jgi:hypothetical protein
MHGAMRRSIGRWRQSTLKPVAKIRKSSSIGPADVRTCSAPPRSSTPTMETPR